MLQDIVMSRGSNEVDIAARPLAGAARTDVRDELLAVYREAFFGPPWNETEEHVAAYAARLDGDAQRDGASLAVARMGGMCVGFATGWVTPSPFPDETSWHRAICEALGDGVVNGRLAGSFELDELAVVHRMRRRGVGRKLLDALITDGSAAWLVTSQRATAAIGLYRSLGWNELRGEAADGSTVVVFATAPI